MNETEKKIILVSPEEIIQSLMTFCEENNLGLAQFAVDGLIVIMMSSFHPDDAALSACQILINTVMSGANKAWVKESDTETRH